MYDLYESNLSRETSLILPAKYQLDQWMAFEIKQKSLSQPFFTQLSFSQGKVVRKSDDQELKQLNFTPHPNSKLEK